MDSDKTVGNSGHNLSPGIIHATDRLLERIERLALSEATARIKNTELQAELDKLKKSNANLIHQAMVADNSLIALQGDYAHVKAELEEVRKASTKWRTVGMKRLGTIESLQAELEKAKETISRLEREAVVAETAYRELQDKYRWIPVTERLPKSPTQYLGLNMFEGTSQKPWMGIVTTWSKADGFYSEGGTTQIEITHWKPIILPE